jgi:hypothetical protein
MKIMSYINSLARNFSILLLMLLLFFQPFAVPEAPAQRKCETELTDARKQFFAGNFDDAKTLVEQCLNKRGLSKDERKQAYELLAEINSSNKDTAQVKIATQELLKVDPEYKPPDDAHPLFIRLVNEAKLAIKPKKGNRKKWLWVGAGSLAAAGIATTVILISNKGDEDGFVLPPGRPPR